jgi:uncharacterized protein with WD repeat
MELSTTRECPCRPGFLYKNLTQHQKTKIHKAWETSQEVKDVRVQSKKYENEIQRLKNRLAHKEEVEVVLLKRIEYLEKQLEGVFL